MVEELPYCQLAHAVREHHASWLPWARSGTSDVLTVQSSESSYLGGVHS